MSLCSAHASVEALCVNIDFIVYCCSVLVPHLGSATVKTREAMAVLAAQNVLKGLAGEEMICPL